MFEIFQYDFMVRALAAGLVVAIVAPLVGMFLVVRRFSYLADTLAHVSLLGVATALLAGVSPVPVAVGVSVIAGWGIERLRRNPRLFSESILAVFLSGSLALAIVLISLGGHVNQDLFSYLFGSITTVRPSEVWTIVGVGVAVLITTVALYKEFFLLTLHEELAAAEGLSVNIFSITLMILAAVSIAVAMRIVGGLLVGALMVIPVLAATQLTRSFRATALWSIALSVAATLFGLILSFYYNLPSGATIVVVTLIMLIIALWLAPRRVS